RERAAGSFKQRPYKGCIDNTQFSIVIERFWYGVDGVQKPQNVLHGPSIGATPSQLERSLFVFQKVCVKDLIYFPFWIRDPHYSHDDLFALSQYAVVPRVHPN